MTSETRQTAPFGGEPVRCRVHPRTARIGADPSRLEIGNEMTKRIPHGSALAVMGALVACSGGSSNNSTDGGSGTPLGDASGGGIEEGGDASTGSTAPSAGRRRLLHVVVAEQVGRVPRPPQAARRPRRGKCARSSLARGAAGVPRRRAARHLADLERPHRPLPPPGGEAIPAHDAAAASNTSARTQVFVNTAQPRVSRRNQRISAAI
jgi:hypothetical protein